jgi:alpha-L-rhamnosidase
VVLDLGHEQEIDAVKLFPVITLDDSPQATAIFFPHRFKVEVANTPQFEDARTVIDRTAEDIPEPHTVAQLYKMKPVTARYIRLIVTGLRMPRRSDAIYALSEIQVLSNGTNLAQNAKVSVSDSDESPGWSKERLVDGVTKTVFPPPLVQPSAYLRKDFDIPGELIRATVYVTARGVYELRLNSQRVGDHLLAPEWTSYHHRLQYQTYDVPPLVREEQNAMGAILAAGWYSGRIGLVPRRRVYGPFPQLLLRLDVELRSGKTVSVVSNDSWQKASDVPLESSDILDGEIYDARKEMKGWDSWVFQAKGWQSVETDADLGAAKLV